jgi:hypothetical protein
LGWQVLVWYFDHHSTDNGNVRKFFTKPIIEHLDGHVYNKIPYNFSDDFYIDVWDFVRALEEDKIVVLPLDVDNVLKKIKCVIDEYMMIWETAYKDRELGKQVELKETKGYD